MFRTLRGKLVASHVLLVLLLLLLTGTATGVLVTRALRRNSLNRSRALAVNLAQRLSLVPATVARGRELLDRVGRESDRTGGRVLLLAQGGEIILDSEGEYEGQRIALPAVPARRPLVPLAIQPDITRQTMADGKDYFVVLVDLTLQVQNRRARYLGLAIEIEDVDPPWRALLVPLLFVGAAATLLAIVLAFALAHSISRPIRKMTQATAAMAVGDYDQPVQVTGHDEIAHLAVAFGHMRDQVASAQRTQRDFLANVSHDLRTPLTSIQGFSQAILEGAVTDENGYRRAAEIINGEAGRMARLVADLLELARLEGGQLDLASEPISLAELLRTETAKAAARAEQAGLQIHASIPEDLPGIVADVNRVEQAIANLLDNATKYAKPNSSITIQARAWKDGMPRPEALAVSFGPSNARGRWISLDISNFGESIPRADLVRIFERFYRGDRSRTRAEGSGLGLAIVRETALAHGGRIEVGSGSTALGDICFRLWLPVTAQASAGAVLAQSA